MYKQTDIRRRLVYSIPLWWQDILEMRNIHDHSAEELAKWWIQFQRYVDSRSPITADAEKLVKWEVVYGIPVDMEKPLEDRRSVVTAKMRGVGIVTPALVKRTAESFEFGEVDVDEDNGRVLITFISAYGVPSFLDDIKKVLRALIPAHLEIDYRFLYNTYADVYNGVSSYAVLANSGLTYEEVLNTELDFDENGTINNREFYEELGNGTKRNVTASEERTSSPNAISAGATLLSLADNPFTTGMEVTVYDGAHSEDTVIAFVNGLNITVNALQHAYAAGASVVRSNAVTRDGKMQFENFGSYSISASEVT